MSEVNFKHELKRGYLMFRAFEHGMKLAEEIDNLEGNIQSKSKELSELDAKIKKSGVLYDVELDKIADEIEQIRKKAMEDIELLRLEHGKEKDALVKKIAGLNEDVKKLDAKVKGKIERSTELDIEIAQKEKDLNNFNKEIEETKTKFRSMF